MGSLKGLVAFVMKTTSHRNKKGMKMLEGEERGHKSEG